MHVIVLGAGVVGVTTAYYLAQRGCRVTVMDQAGDVAEGCSHANGSQLSYGFADTFATPDLLRKIPALLAGRDFAVRIRMNPALVPWGLRFLAECRSHRSRRNALALLKTANRSARLMDELLPRLSHDFCYRSAGKIVLLTTEKEVRSAEKSMRFKLEHGCEIEMLSASEAEAIEPALSAFDGPILAAVFARDDKIADARLFCVGLRTLLEAQHGVRFQLGNVVDGLQLSDGRIAGVISGSSEQDAMPADAVVVCLGIGSNALLRRAGIKLPIYPVRGYSVTLPVGSLAPSASVTSLTNRFVFSRLNDKIRIAGFTDFDGLNEAADAERIQTLVAAAERLAPKFADYDCDRKNPWGNFRPMTPGGLPLVGRTRVDGLFLNTGHGMLGWTLACATAKSVAEAVMDGDR